MFKSYIVESDLYKLVPEIETDLYKWTGQTDHSGQGIEAVNRVKQDLINAGFNLRQLMKPLELSTTGVEDEVNRLRWVVTSTAGGTAILYGSDDDETYSTIETETVTTGTTSYIIPENYKHYKTGGTSTFTSVLVDTTFDDLIKSKWIEFIMMNAGKGTDNKYTNYGLAFRENYNTLFNKMVIPVDIDDDGEAKADERSKTTSIDMIR